MFTNARPYSSIIPRKREHFGNRVLLNAYAQTFINASGSGALNSRCWIV